LTAGKNSLEHALEEAVSRALRDNLAPLQRTADELNHACADLVAACASSRPSNALPSLLRAQASASALAAGLSVLSNFVAVALNPREQHSAQESAASPATAVADLDPPVTADEAEAEIETADEVAEEEPAHTHEVEEVHSHAVNAADEVAAEAHLEAHHAADVTETIDEPVTAPVEPEKAKPFDVASLPSEMQDMHKRANRVAKVAMQDIKLLQPKEVRAGREHKDICVRLKVDIDKARKEYDRRFHAIQDHPVDYFHHWMVEILAGGDSNALGAYPYPSPVLRH
jgi:hypothetical protein